MPPFGTYQTTPSTSRNRVVRNETSSTVPVAKPRSTTSPTPTWSSMMMNAPLIRSRSRFCAPNASATPISPALVSTAAPEIAEHREDERGRDDPHDDRRELARPRAIVCARSCRRVVGVGALDSGSSRTRRPPTVIVAAFSHRVTARRTTRRSSRLATTAPRMMTTTVTHGESTSATLAAPVLSVTLPTHRHSHGPRSGPHACWTTSWASTAEAASTATG